MAPTKMTYKEHKEESQVLFQKDFFTESNWKEYPSHRITAIIMPYSWVTAQWNDYAWTKVKIINAKLQEKDWQVQVRQKTRGQYIVDDQKETDMKVDDFKTFIIDCNKILSDIEA